MRSRGPCRFVTVVILAVLCLSAIPPTLASADTISATVVSTDAVNIRSCPQLSCDIVATASLGDALTVTGRPDNGFLPVSYGGASGYAYGLYVQMAGAPVPFLSQGTAGCNRVALIFDIGIGDAPDPQVLDILEGNNVPATMFVMGWFARAYPEFLNRMVNDGFVIGTHGDQPVELTGLSNDQIAAALDASAQAITSATGSPPGPWFTPYAAAVDNRIRSVAASKGYLPIGWTIAADDYEANRTADYVYHRVTDNIADGSIVELHLDGPATAQSTAAALPKIITTIRNEGYTFVTIPEMANPC